ncbi:MAG TPA: superoxide dismutase [Planctomycetota bacterium]|jgi:Fe-Mn family superoxide dismutase|nr:superoxide dismutase [Fe] [Planctomycetota bacterium]MDP6128710.1 superoxide dismutase [Planctomycetota bacterium]MDP7246094.1 superoxide dismutase [Planctomycetota bacterium]HJM38650.1 superoxide dismutase [Planctomycetota bacterium]|tara:strand:- start:18252 stop:18845 length:594 start_codon:yes stop_codon:yes gene_type:complete
MSYELPELPYASDALEPHISAETFSYHHGKHHAAYVNKLNEMTDGDDSKSLEELIRTAEGGLFNQAAQVWNHTFYWSCMAPGGGGAPSGDLAEAIVRDFGSFEDFTSQFKAAAAGQFGSGWAWLCWNGSSLEICTTANAGNPMTDGKTPLLTCDVWEHAYYVDFRNARPKYLATFFESLVNWEFVSANYASYVAATA